MALSFPGRSSGAVDFSDSHEGANIPGVGPDCGDQGFSSRARFAPTGALPQTQDLGYNGTMKSYFYICRLLGIIFCATFCLSLYAQKPTTCVVSAAPTVVHSEGLAERVG